MKCIVDEGYNCPILGNEDGRYCWMCFHEKGSGKHLVGPLLKKAAEKLHEEVQIIGKQVEDLEKQREKAMENLKLLEKKKRELEALFHGNGDSGGLKS